MSIDDNNYDNNSYTNVMFSLISILINRDDRKEEDGDPDSGTPGD